MSLRVGLVLSRVSSDQLLTWSKNSYSSGIGTAIAHAAWECLNDDISQRRKIALSIAVRDEFCRSLARRLERSGRRVLNAGDGGHFGARASCVFTPPLLAKLPELYPGLARIWNAQLNGWASFVAAFVGHLAAFQRILQGSDAIEGIETDLSDYHDGGRSVTRVKFLGLGNWFYKPRGGEREAAWSELVRALNSAGFDPPFLVPQVYPSQRHCWMRGIDTIECQSLAEYRRFDRRAGALLYLAHRFRAVDLHAANIIAHGEHPVLIDCETLFHPETPLPPAVQLVERGLIRTGMLSQGKNDNSNPFIVLRQRAIKAGRGHIEVLHGFQSMHRFLLRHLQSDEIRRAVHALRESKTRLILRPTLLYRRILDTLGPRELQYAKGPERFLRSRLDDGLFSEEVVREEIRQLLHGDIPRFSGKSTHMLRSLNLREFQQVVQELKVDLKL
jgi:lantibiotic modifying enzyme